MLSTEEIKKPTLTVKNTCKDVIMNKKLSQIDLDMPVDDWDCWNRYPKHRWVYELSRLYDSQNINWSLTPTDLLDYEQKNLTIDTADSLADLGKIYTKNCETITAKSEAYVIKGEIKHIAHLYQESGLEVGQTEIRITAFIALYFSKFTGVISFTTHQRDIVKISLKPESDLDHIEDKEIAKLVKRIYKKQDSQVIGLTDRVFRESLAS